MSLAEDEIRAQYEEALRMAYLMCKGERLRVLRGGRIMTWDKRGLHPFSVEVGRIFSLKSLMPGIDGDAFDPMDLRSRAERDALEEFKAEVRESSDG